MSGKPWPNDALMIVAAKAGEEQREHMEAVHYAECRDCGCRLAVDTKSLRDADAHPARHGRPVRFFCYPCSETYDLRMVGMLQDNRGNNCSLEQAAADLTAELDGTAGFTAVGVDEAADELHVYFASKPARWPLTHYRGRVVHLHVANFSVSAISSYPRRQPDKPVL